MNLEERQIKINKAWFQRKLKEGKTTQVKMAAALDITPAALSLVLSGKRRLYVDELGTIADFLGCSILDVIAAATNKDPIEVGLQKDHLISAIVDAERTLEEKEVTLSPEKKSELVSLIYQLHVLNNQNESATSISRETIKLLLETVKGSA